MQCITENWNLLGQKTKIDLFTIPLPFKGKEQVYLDN